MQLEATDIETKMMWRWWWWWWWWRWLKRGWRC